MFKPLHVVYCPICKQFLVKFARGRSFRVMWAEVDDRWEQIWANWIQPNLWSTIRPDVHFYALWIYVKNHGILFSLRNLFHNSILSGGLLWQPLSWFAPFLPTFMETVVIWLEQSMSWTETAPQLKLRKWAEKLIGTLKWEEGGP